jgi:hypothetical protein
VEVNKGLRYLEMYPDRTEPWMNRCRACQRIGYKPELPENIPPGIVAQNLRMYFRPLALDDRGLCEMCAESLARKGQ